MILKELYELAQREKLVAEAGFQPVPISYVVNVGTDGSLQSIVPTLHPPANGKGKPVPQAFQMPAPVVRPGNQAKAQFLWDNPVYVFGLDLETKPEKKRPAEWLQRRHLAFVESIKQAAAETGDEALRAVAKLVDAWLVAPPTLEDLVGLGVGHLEPNSNITFQYASDRESLVIERPGVRNYWAAQSQKGLEGVAEKLCVVTGAMSTPARLHTPIKRIPGGMSQGLPIISFNQASFESYGLSGNENASVGHNVAEGVATALNRLLNRQYPHPETNEPMPSRRFDLATDTALLFWSKGGDDTLDVFRGSLDADPEAVNALYGSPWKGREVDLQDDSRFFALALSGEMARAKVRGWLETTLGQALRNVRQHFEDISVVRRDESLPVPLWRLLTSLAALGERERLAPDLAARTMEAIIRGSPYPRTMLDAAVRRSRMEKDGVTAERAACIKAYLLRARRAGRLSTRFPEVKTHMDPEQTNTAYRLGRLFATLEKLQEEALPGLNATIRDRFFGAASATPITVFPRLIRGAQPHVSKAKRGRFFDMKIQEIVQPLAGFPSHLTLEEQGLFALGYYQQRQAYFAKKPTDGDTTTDSETETIIQEA